jgi:hypothetical protein
MFYGEMASGARLARTACRITKNIPKRRGRLRAIEEVRRQQYQIRDGPCFWWVRDVL